ncbi:hypothetical protein [Haloplanus sp. C73]|uniref:hypothetical protein n=1 Tax=Haloplanus sp. C73 TaxID=3421641 RepID=UPI003EBB4C4C
MDRDLSGDVVDVLGQLFDAGATALDDGDADTARQVLTSAETVATNKLPEGEFRTEVLRDCRRALDRLDDGAFDAAAEDAAALARRFDF